MDDILASIRRIIADDYQPKAADSGTDAGEPLVLSDDGHEAPFFASEPPVAEVAESVEAALVPPARADEAPEIQARPIGEAASESWPAPRQMPPPTLVRPVADAVVSRTAAPVEPVPTHGSLAPEPRPTAPGPVHQPVHGPVLDALVSSATTASVGESFHALSHTILTSNNARTLEDIVKDMLRPMLQVWLDDNLPPLVERLVRTEIERVARGRP